MSAVVPKRLLAWERWVCEGLAACGLMGGDSIAAGDDGSEVGGWGGIMIR